MTSTTVSADEALNAARAALNEAQEHADAVCYLAHRALKCRPGDYERTATLRAILALSEKLHSDIDDSRPKWDTDATSEQGDAA